MVWACFTSERLDPLIVCNEGGSGADKYENIIYDGLFILIDNLLELSDSLETICIAHENTFLFI